MAFTEETFAFLREIEANNDKAWFDANRSRYKAEWRDPALDFIARISADMSHLDPPLLAEPKLNGSLRRINRDVRFSKDKTPYNPMLHMIFWAGDHPNRSPGMHIVLTKMGVGYGAGLYGIEPDKLAMLRNRILDRNDGDILIAALEGAAEIGCTMGDPDLARVPQGYAAEGRRAELLRHKSIVARTFGNEASASVMTGPGAHEWAMKTTRALLPLIRWLLD